MCLKDKSGQDRMLILTGGFLGGTCTDVGAEPRQRASYGVIAHISDLSLKPHKQDGSVLETGRPQVSNKNAFEEFFFFEREREKESSSFIECYLSDCEFLPNRFLFIMLSVALHC